MKFIQTSRGCLIEFNDNEEFAGKSLFLRGEKFSNGYMLGSMLWENPDKDVVSGSEEEKYLRNLVKCEGKKQGIEIGFYDEVRKNETT